MARVLLVDDDAAGLPVRKLVLERTGHRADLHGHREAAMVDEIVEKPAPSRSLVEAVEFKEQGSLRPPRP